MLRVNEMDVAGPTGNQVADIVQDARDGTVPKAGLAAQGAWALGKVAATSHDFRFGEIFRVGDALRRVRKILPGTRHGKALLGQAILAKNLRHLPSSVMVNFHVMMLKTHHFVI
jgi:hypothetical protein